MTKLRRVLAFALLLTFGYAVVSQQGAQSGGFPSSFPPAQNPQYPGNPTQSPQYPRQPAQSPQYPQNPNQSPQYPRQTVQSPQSPVAPGEYDEAAARIMVSLCAASYFNETALTQSLQQSLPNIGEIQYFNKKCDLLPGSTCAALIAVLHQPKAIAVVFRGTTTDGQLTMEKLSIPMPKVDFQGVGRVCRYFANAYDVLWNQAGMGAAVEQLRQQYPDYPLWVTGHSLGAAISALASVALVNAGKVGPENSLHINFGQPRVGDKAYAAAVNKLVPYLYRVAHANDTVTTSPPTLFYYEHHSTEVWYPESMAPGAPKVMCAPEDPTGACGTRKRGSWEDHLHYFGQKVGLLLRSANFLSF